MTFNQEVGDLRRLRFQALLRCTLDRHQEMA